MEIFKKAQDAIRAHTFGLLVFTAFCFVFFTFYFSPLLSQADTLTSTSFTVKDSTIGNLGGYATSTSFGSAGAGLVISGGQSTSTSFMMRSGPLNTGFAPKSQNWRFYDDETDETPVIPLANENTSPVNIANQNIIKLRLTIKETAGVGSANQKFKLQFSEYSDFSQGVSDAVEIGSCVSNSLWCYANASGTDNAVITTKLLTDSDPCSGGVGAGCGTHNTSGISTSTFAQAASSSAEYEFAVKQAGARANATYFFRAYDVTNSSPVPLNTGKNYPSLSIEGATLTFSVGGLPAGTSTEGIVTDATTTATGVSLGTLPIASDIKAAQRFTITTNATEGYEIFAYENQGLLSGGGSEIPPLAATNANPAAWNSGCTATSTGCFGYHPGDDVLSGGSTRFAVNDTFARFETSTREIGWSGGPVTAKTSDIVLRVLAHGNQDVGNYQSSINYIIVPVF